MTDEQKREREAVKCKRCSELEEGIRQAASALLNNGLQVDTVWFNSTTTMYDHLFSLLTVSKEPAPEQSPIELLLQISNMIDLFLQRERGE